MRRSFGAQQVAGSIHRVAHLFRLNRSEENRIRAGLQGLGQPGIVSYNG